MGTPEFSVSALKALHKSAHEIVSVYSQPPRPKGRGQQVQNSPVHEYAAHNNIPVFTPKSLKSAEAQAEFAAHNLDVAVVVAYGLLLPKPILEAPKHGCLNIHASLLPRWRGASPIQQSIWHGDKQTGVTIMQMDEGLDTGPMLYKKSVEILPSTTTQILHDQLSFLGAEMIAYVIDELAVGRKMDAQIQDNAQTTYAPLLKKEDGKIDWTQSAEQIDRQIRALNPWPGTWCEYNGNRIKILQAQLIDNVMTDAPGKILDRDGHIATANGILKLEKIQPSNAKPMDFAAALNGNYLKVGACLE
jgi:methionyl-tRNA formyltransferase